MIVEFIGCTGAGKTTLITEVQRELAPTADVYTPYDLIAAKLGLTNITNTTARNLIQEFYGIWYLLWSLPRYGPIIAFSVRKIVRKADSIKLTINNLRSLVRKLGVYAIVQRQPDHHIILVDEGTVLLAYILFVYNRAYYSSEELVKFARLIPLPDKIIYVKAPVDILINRSLQRSNPPREMKSKDPALVKKYIVDAVTMFDQLVQTKEIRNRIINVNNPDCAAKQPKKAAKYVTEFVHSSQKALYNQVAS